MFLVVVTPSNGRGWKETFSTKAEAVAYANKYESSCYVYIKQLNYVPLSYNYVGD